MKNPVSALVQAYYNIISNAQIVFNGSILPVYDGMAPDSELGSYILIGDRSAQQTDDKCGYLWNCQILVDVVIKNGSFGFLDSDTVAEQIGELINTRLNPTMTDFQAITTSANWNCLPGLNPTEPTFRTLIRYYHVISQK